MSDASTTIASQANAWRELNACWQRLPNKSFFFAILAAWVALFQFWGNSTFGYINSSSLLYWMYRLYTGWSPNSDADRQGLIIPVLVIGLFWWKRNKLLNLPLRIRPLALLLVGFGLVLHIVGYMIQEPRLSIVAMFLGIYGIMGLAWGFAWLRHSFFPFFLFAFCMPMSGLLEPVTFPLRLLVSTLAQWVAHYVLGIGVQRVGTQLFDPFGTYQYDVAAACSGIRSFVAFFLLCTVYGFVAFQSKWKRCLMVALAFPFAVVGNLLRMLLIIVAAALGGQRWGNYVHENVITSLVPYVPAILGLLLVGRWLEERAAVGSLEKPAT